MNENSKIQGDLGAGSPRKFYVEMRCSENASGGHLRQKQSRSTIVAS